ncbi:MAG: DUF4347 domain-containing protein [Magnetococcales bacterium]|nr:DUF4347 domain-containing protein [Magnetococcales bacterium]
MTKRNRIPSEKPSRQLIAPLLLALEPRWMFDGAAAVDAAHAVTEASAHATDTAAEQISPDSNHTAAEEARSVPLEPLSASESSRRLLLLSSSISQREVLAEAVNDQVTVVRYEVNQDDSHSLLQKIEEALAGDLAESIAFVSHNGNDGALHILNSLPMNRFTLALDYEVQSFWREIGSNLSSNGRIDLLGCSVAASAEGEALLHSITALSNHAVAASSDATGNPGHGDWLLERGNIDAAACYFNAGPLAAYSGRLGTAVGIYITNAAGTDATLLKEIVPGGDPYIYEMVTLNDKVLFFAETEDENRELWITDGTTAGTQMLLDINPGTDSSSLGYGTELVLCNNKIFFQADDGVHGEELWVTDGTAAGTTLVKDIWAGSIDSSIRTITAFNNKVFFYAQDGTGYLGYHDQLWVSDGTTAGTQLVKDMPNGAMRHLIYPSDIAATSNALYFVTKADSSYEQLWKTIDGTAATTELVKSFGNGGGYWQTDDGHGGKLFGPSLTAIGDKLYFDAYTTSLGVEAWVSDGTSAGTFNLTDDGSSAVTAHENLFGLKEPVQSFVEFNGKVYFTYYEKFYQTDGTVAGTSVVSGIEDPLGYISFGNSLYFSLSTGSVPDYEIYSYDGTTLTRIIDLNSAPPGALPGYYYPIGNQFYFIPYNETTYGPELWVSDGSTAGTHLVKDIFAGSDPSYPGNFTTLNGKLLFTAETYANEPPRFSDAGDGYASVAINSQEVNLNEFFYVTDWDPGQTLTWSQSSAPSHGTLTFTDATHDSEDSWILPNGSITYTPAPDFVGSDSFVIQVSDGTAGDTRTIHVNVINNTTPQFVSSTPVALTVYLGSSWVDLGPYLHLDDPDSDQALVLSEESNPEQGSLWLSSDPITSGSNDIAPPSESYLYYLPWSTGSDQFTIQVSDDIATASLIFNVTIVENHTPTFVSQDDQTLTVAINSSEVNLIPYLTANDSDSNQTLTWEEWYSPSYGTLSITAATAASGQAAITPGGTILYTPPADFAGTDEFALRVWDGFNNSYSVKYFTVNVQDFVNTPPEIVAIDGPTYTDTGGMDPFQLVYGPITVYDPDTDQTLTYSLVDPTFTSPSGTSKLGTYGTLAVYNDFDQYFFVPFPDAINGLTSRVTERFTITVSDGLATSTTLFSVTLIGANDIPELESPADIRYSDSDVSFNPVSGQLQAWDRDLGQSYTFTVQGGSAAELSVEGILYNVSKSGLYGTLYLDSVDGHTLFRPNEAAIRAVPDSDSETFTVSVSDGVVSIPASFTVHISSSQPAQQETIIPVKPLLPPLPEMVPVILPPHEWINLENNQDMLEEIVAGSGVTVIRDKQGGVTIGKNQVVIGVTPVTVIRESPSIGATPVTVIRENNPARGDNNSPFSNDSRSPLNNVSLTWKSARSSMPSGSAGQIGSTEMRAEGIRLASTGSRDETSEDPLALHNRAVASQSTPLPDGIPLDGTQKGAAASQHAPLLPPDALPAAENLLPLQTDNRELAAPAKATEGHNTLLVGTAGNSVRFSEQIRSAHRGTQLQAQARLFAQAAQQLCHT